MKAANVAEAVKSEHAVALLKQMYGENRAEENAARYQLVADGFTKEFGDKEFEFFSAPGRTEIETSGYFTGVAEKVPVYPDRRVSGRQPAAI